jgi:segregation and condensation protein A
VNNVSSFPVKTESFEGPMELLIELVEKRKFLINDISLAAVTDEYMQTVSLMQELSLPNTSQFVNLAATLLLIKSKSLLPSLDLTTEEETSIEVLETRLKKYQIYRDASLKLQGKFGGRIMYEPEYVPPREPFFVPDIYCDTKSLQESLRHVLTNLPKTQVKHTAQVKKTISLEDMMQKLRTRIEHQLQTKFSEIRSSETEHKNVIVGFLAILELFKQGNVIITQSDKFEDIHLELDQAKTPRYY